MRAERKAGASAKGKGIDKATIVPRRARLAFMMKLPQDIFRDIAIYLSPLDLLRMARSSKTLRALLFSRSSKPIWRASRLSLPTLLPDGPEDLSEPIYASLIFDRGCFGCGATNAGTPFFALRKRFCKSCLKELTGMPMFSMAELELGFRNLVPRSRYSGDAIYSKSLDPDYYDSVVVMADYRAMAERYKSAIQEGEEAAAKFRNEKFEEVKNIMDHAYQIQDWKRIEKLRKNGERIKIIRLRTYEITDRLKAMGYSDNNILLHYFDKDRGKRWKKLVRQNKELTERAWKKLLPQLVDILESR